MKIENGSLVVTVQGVEKTVPLPTVAADAKVKAWAVPADYRADGLFVAVTIKANPRKSRLAIWRPANSWASLSLMPATTPSWKP